MKLKLLAILIGITLIAASLFGFGYLIRSSKRSESASIPLLKTSGSEIARTPVDQVIRFEAVVLNRPLDNCIDLFIPDEFEKYNGDIKWSISSTLGFKPGLFDGISDKRTAIVTGKYVFVRDVEAGPCNLVTGHLFVIDKIEYY